MKKILDEMDPWENPVIEFDFAGELAVIDSASVSISPGGPAMLDGAPQINGASVYQRIKSGAALDATNYHIRCEAVDGVERRVRAAVILVRRA